MARSLVSLIALGVAAAPLVLALLLGLQRVRFSGDVGPGSAMVLVMVVAYVVWLPATVFAWVWAQDHLGLHYQYTERARSTKRETRRLWAGMRFMAGRPTFGQGPGPRGRRRGRRPDGGGESHQGGASGKDDDGAEGDR